MPTQFFIAVVGADKAEFVWTSVLMEETPDMSDQDKCRSKIFQR